MTALPLTECTGPATRDQDTSEADGDKGKPSVKRYMPYSSSDTLCSEHNVSRTSIFYMYAEAPV